MRTARHGVLFRLALRFMVVAAAICCAAGPALADPISKEEKDKLLASVESRIERAYASGTDFTKWATIKEKYQQQLDKAETDEVFTRTLNRALREFGISHIDLSTPKAVEDRKKNEMVGIGISHDHRGNTALRDGLEIAEILPGGPAEKAGLQVGDTILKVDSNPLTDPSMLRGEEGSKVTLTLRRKDGTVEDLEIARGKFSTVRPFKLTRISDDAAMIRVPTFSTGYDRKKVEEFFAEVKDDKYLVIDLTMNGGGAVDNMLHFLGFLLPRGTAIGTSVSKRVADRYASETQGDPTDVVAVAKWADAKMRVRRGTLTPFAGKVAVLTNGASASASEIVANAMRELKEGILVGGPTAGAVLVSTPMKLDDGFEMKVPVSDYVTIKGSRLEKHPTKPDLVVPVLTFKQIDVAARKAVDRMKNPPAQAEEPKDPPADAKHEAAEPIPAGMP